MKVSETTHARTGRFGWRDRNNIAAPTLWLGDWRFDSISEWCALKGRSARYCLQTYRPRRRKNCTADRGNRATARTWRVLRAIFRIRSSTRRATSRDSDIKLEMISFVPSCNTDQGAFYSREY